MGGNKFEFDTLRLLDETQWIFPGEKYTRVPLTQQRSRDSRGLGKPVGSSAAW